jgi:hypothetical protein
LGGNPSHLLYFWQLLEEHDLLKNTLSIIPSEISATNESVPETVTYTTPGRKRSKIDEEFFEHQKSFQSNVKLLFAEMAKSSTVVATNSNLLLISSLRKDYLLLISSLRKDYLTLHQQYSTETDPETKAILKEMAEDAKTIYENAKRKSI